MTVSNPFFSIIIPTYNRAHYLTDNLKSVLNQSFDSFEIVLVDDGSNDDTECVIKSLSSGKIQYFKTENLERSHARNLGMKKASGRYINYFDSDDAMYFNRLKIVFDFLESNGMPEVIFTHYEFVSLNRKIIGRIERHYKSFTKDILFNNFLATGSVFMKREVALKFPFHEDRRIITAEDWELWLRVHTSHDFLECKKFTFAIAQHEQRSLSTISSLRVEERDTYFAALVSDNASFIAKYGNDATKLFVADRYTFIALTHAVNGSKKRALQFLLKSLFSSILVLKRRRFWAALKNMI